MATARPPGGGSTPQARLGIDLSAFRAAPAVAREAGRATAREISNAFKSLQAEQRLALEQARATTVAIRAQQTQITSVTRAESSERISAARAEASVRAQQARAAAGAQIEAERRITATHKAEIRQRETAARANRHVMPSGGAGGVSSLIGVAGGFGIGLGVAELGRTTIELTRQAATADRTRTAYDRLAAGVGASADSMLSSMQRASRGLISDADLILNANRAMLLGVADTSTEMSQLLEVARVRGQAVQISTNEAFTRLAQGIGKREIEILDELGIVIKLIPTYEAYAKSVGKTVDQLTEAEKTAAIFNKVISDSAPLVAAAASEGENAADKFEQAAANIANARQQLGNFFLAAGGAEVAGGLASEIEGVSSRFEGLRRDIERAQAAYENFQRGSGASGETPWYKKDPLGDWARGHRLGEKPGEGLWFDQQPWHHTPGMSSGGGFGPGYGRGGIGARTTIGRGTPQSFAADAFSPDDDQVAALRARAEGFVAIERQTTRSLLEERRSYQQQNASVISNYQKATLREAEDHGRQRANAERKLQMSILDVAQDSARQRVKWEADLARSITQARADSAEKVQEWERDRDERITEARADSAARVAELEKRYAKDRERAAEVHADRMMDAAGSLNAKAVYEEQRNFARQEREAKEAHDEQLDELAEQLQERIDQENEAHDERLADEAKALDKSIRQQQEAHARQLTEQAENDRLRIEDMKAAFEEQKTQEDIERGIRLGRQAEDHNDQLAELGRQHGERIQQIKDKAQEERDQFTEESNAFLEKVGIHNEAWLKEQERINAGVIKRHEELLEAERRGLLNGMGRTPGFPSLENPYQHVPPVPIVPSGSVSSVSNSRSVTIAPGAIVINEAETPELTAEAVRQVIIDTLGED